ncbi:type-4 ice-structuring protein LS-12-like [Anoplopoma fimbria]|uniref:type-4 ice-structuring protein LS-12-like n=1 Tax=Anoplopoma fimbria TaxID=229290 RepID=UPI0023EC4142|nr:type-4 ice-structuring protein LS-12-like [Anoplopoma fimbria]
MKFSIIAALVVVLAVAHGTEAKSVVKRDAQSDMDKFAKLISEMSASITSTTQDMVEKVKALEVTNTAQTYVVDSMSKIQTLAERVQAEATNLQEQAKPYIGNIEEHIRPMTENFKTLTDNLQAQVKTLTDMMPRFFQQVMDQIKELLQAQ